MRPIERNSERTVTRSNVRLELASWKEEAGNKKEAVRVFLYISFMINDEIFTIGSENQTVHSVILKKSFYLSSKVS